MHIALLRPALLFIVALLPQWSNAWSAPSPNLICRHAGGDKLFMNHLEIKLERDGNWVSVTPASAQVHTDIWTYRLAFEDPAVGYRAIRASMSPRSGGTLDVEFGGELFLASTSGEQRLLVTAVSVSSGKVTSQRFSCRNTT